MFAVQTTMFRQGLAEFLKSVHRIKSLSSIFVQGLLQESLARTMERIRVFDDSRKNGTDATHSTHTFALLSPRIACPNSSIWPRLQKQYDLGFIT